MFIKDAMRYVFWGSSKWRRVGWVSTVLVAMLMFRAIGEILFSDFAGRAGPGLSPQSLGHYEYIKRHLQTPFKGYSTRQVLIQEFSVIALSHMACGLLNTAILDPSKKEEIIPLLRETAERAMGPHVSPFVNMVNHPKTWWTNTLYLAHLNFILGCYRRASGDGRYDKLHGDISRFIAEASLKEKDFHMYSFGKADKFPADQSAALLSVFLYDKIHGTSLSRAPIQGWEMYMAEKGTDAAWGLPISHISESRMDRLPRGCAMSWTCFYMAQFDKSAAEKLYRRYREKYFKSILRFGGFREWPPGMSLGMDSDSGPVVFGLGLSASGLGVGPSRLFRDEKTYASLMRLGALVGWPQQWRGKRWYLFSPLLGEAILFNGETAVFWFDEV